MKTITINNFKQFHAKVERYNDNMRFRGVADKNFGLIPKIGRHEFTTNYNKSGIYQDLIDYEEYLMLEFKKYAPQHLTYSPQSEWEWWAIAQHHGLATRLLDWTDNPLVAAYFAVSDLHSKADAAIYVTDCTMFNSNIEDVDSPLEVDEVYIYYPPHINQRIVAQKGMFTVHYDPTCAIIDKHKNKSGDKYFLEKITIPNECKMDFKRILNLYGINASTIYPGLDGITSYLEWKTLHASRKGAE
ncbi:FRG domain-containing protein [Seleniivibrio woodruffii]|uniref:FRG domain-containing protein n=1 Tax=Seleniivibrio woodruffii TaxID=1078050 RepID=A0A4R1K2Z8_9BACT|nr:FRG domain-containing protein [Seleniivibrio woodruffii]TCK58434.1 FRG domain-containing protein [Seleniivibrio woodruffii]TVZ36807.1 FRG domain-containing protein [Seleniivibrio woodruffii]